MKSIQNANIKKLGNGIALVTINDPKSYNSLSTVTLKSLLNIFQKLNNDNFINKASNEIIEKFKNDAQNHKSSIEKIDQIINTIN